MDAGSFRLCFAKSFGETVIAIFLAGHDFVGLSQPGTGKTLACIIPLAAKILEFLEKSVFDGRDGSLADQVSNVVDQICRPFGILRFVLVGGFSIQEQARSFGTGFHVLITTPGQLNDVLESHLMTLLQCSLIVIDEADKMSDESFGPQIATIVSELPTNRHCMLLSATMPDAILSRLK